MFQFSKQLITMIFIILFNYLTIYQINLLFYIQNITKICNSITCNNKKQIKLKK